MSSRRFVRDTAIVVGILGFLGWFYTSFDSVTGLQDAPLVTVDSPFTGSVKRDAGGFTIGENGESTSMAVTPVALKKKTRYLLTVEAVGEPELHIDFWGPNYDGVEQEVWLSEGPKRGVQGFVLNSGDAPKGTLLRIFFHDTHSIFIKSILLKEQPHVPAWLGILILLAGGIIGGLYALRYRSNRWVTAAGLGIFVTLVYFLVRVPQSDNVGDNFWYVPTAESLLKEGNPELSEYKPWFGGSATDPRITQVGGRYYNLFPLGTSVLAAPLVLIGEHLAGNRTEPIRSLFLASFSAKVLAGLAVSLMFLVLLQLVGHRSVALFLSLCFAFCTSHFSLHAGGLWSHNGGALILTAVVLLLLYGQGRLVPLVGPLLVLGYTVRPDLAISALVMTAYIWWRHRSSFPLFAFLMGLSVLGFVGYCYATFGTVLPPYYTGSGMTGEHVGLALVGNLFSPNRGLFVFTPIALFSVFGIYLAVRRRHPLYSSLSVVVFLHWLSISMFTHWWAGYSYGPRFFALVTPLLVVLFVPAWEQLPKMSRRARFSVLALFFVAASWSLLVHLRGATSPGTRQWNARPSVDQHPERVWDWRDWQPLSRPR